MSGSVVFHGHDDTRRKIAVTMTIFAALIFAIAARLRACAALGESSASGIKLAALDGKPLSIADARRKVLLTNVWGT
jgi:hypothetical protein